MRIVCVRVCILCVSRSLSVRIVCMCAAGSMYIAWHYSGIMCKYALGREWIKSESKWLKSESKWLKIDRKMAQKYRILEETEP